MFWLHIFGFVLLPLGFCSNCSRVSSWLAWHWELEFSRLVRSVRASSDSDTKWLEPKAWKKMDSAESGLVSKIAGKNSESQDYEV